MDLHQSEFNPVKEELFKIEIKNEPCFDNETQVKYEEKGSKRPHNFTKRFQCTFCDFSCTSGSTTTILKHNYSHETIMSSLSLDPKRKRLNNNTPLFVKRDNYDPSNTCFICSVCGIAKDKWIDMKHHTQKHAYNASKYRCKGCDFKSDIDAEFEIHKIENHTIEVNLYYNKWLPSTLRPVHVPIKCSECEYTSYSEFPISLHMMKHSGKHPYTCKHSGCDFIARSSALLNRHMILKHTSERTFKCKHIGCNFAAKLPDTLKTHMKSHTGKNLFDCPKCEFKSTQKIKFNVHMKEYHLDRVVENVVTHQEESSYCTQFDSHKDLGIRPRCQNSDFWNKSFQCQECKRIFNSNYILENHKLSHANHYSTNKLEGKDDIRNNIQNHVTSHENINLEDEKFECSLCDYISSSEKDIQEHSSICINISDSYK